MGLYSNGTFRVGPPPSFLFSDKDITYYSHTIDLWNDKHIWENIKNKYRSLHGSLKGAQIIEEGLTYLNQYQPGSDNEAMTEEEISIMQEVLGRKRLSLLRYSEGLSSKKRGRNLEKDFSKLVEQLTSGTNQVDVGSKRISSPIVINAQIDLTGSGIGIGTFYQKSANYQNLLSIIEEQLNQDFQETLGKGLEIEVKKIIKATQGTSLGNIIIRQSKGTGKVDTSARFRAAINFSSRVSEIVQQMANELAGHTFSLKNYKEGTLLDASQDNPNGWGGISLGNANEFRFFGSFYQAATKSKKQLNFADLCTFIYASQNSKSSEVKNYLSWARFVYELTGLGQSDIVDYLIINNSTAGTVRVYSVKNLLSDMPYGQPPATMKEVSQQMWNGTIRTSNKFIFSVK